MIVASASLAHTLKIDQPLVPGPAAYPILQQPDLTQSTIVYQSKPLTTHAKAPGLNEKENGSRVRLDRHLRHVVPGLAFVGWAIKLPAEYILLLSHTIPYVVGYHSIEHYVPYRMVCT